MMAVQVIVPEGVDDPARPSGGNTYDRRLCRGLASAGCAVDVHAVAGAWPAPDRAAAAALGTVLDGLPEGAVVLVDGLVASAVPEVLVRASARLRVVVLLHMSLGELRTGPADAASRECSVLSAACAVVTTSAWSRDRLLDRYRLLPERVHVAAPGVDLDDVAPGTPGGGELLCVAAVIPGKGHDVLLAALAAVVDLSWHCRLVGDLGRDRGFVERLERQAASGGIADRVTFGGPRTGDDLATSYANADALVLATRGESFGMVVSEALARGLPVIATAVGGLPEALGRLPDGRTPGLLVPPDDADALSLAVRRWLEDADLRRSLRQTARARRETLTGWQDTCDRVQRVLSEVAA